MKRREFISGAATSLVLGAGCVSRINTGDENTAETESTTDSQNNNNSKTTYTDSKPQFQIRSDSLPNDSPVKISIKTISKIGGEKPMTIRIIFTNVSNSELKILFGVTPPFTDLYNEQILVVPTDEKRLKTETGSIIPKQSKNGCWKANTEEFVIPMEQTERTLRPKESIQRDYAVLDNPAADGCFPQGEYRFETSYELENKSPSAGRSTFNWGFTIVVS